MTDRRSFSKTALSALAIGPARPVRRYVKPAALKPGDTVGMIMPASPLDDRARITAAQELLASMGLRWKMGAYVEERDGYLAGSVEHRLADLHAMFRDPEVKMVWCIRGGYGTPTLLAGLDLALIRRNPKLFCGYSDITALHLALQQKCGLMTLHGPNAASKFPEYTLDFFRRAIFEAKPLGRLANPTTPSPGSTHSVRVIRPGKARGRITGGNLSLIAATMGTPFEIETAGRILCIEDVGEEPYRIDRMLANLQLAGKLDQAAGVVLGECSDCEPKGPNSLSLDEVFNRYFGRLKVPVISGLTFGHTTDQFTLPIGASALLETEQQALVVEEAATS
jgi:muramoyltetrapeptide carboxypeptidase